jgi:hypothetical protein
MWWSTRNAQGLSREEIEHCKVAWEALLESEGINVKLDVSRASQAGTMTSFSEKVKRVYLGANAYPGIGIDANSRMSMLACLAHELAHARRFKMGYRRPIDLPDVLLDESETSIAASFTRMLNPVQRRDLVEDARDRLLRWLAEKEV